MPTSTMEDYLKAIYVEAQRAGGALVPTGQIAASLRVAPGTATSMVKSLAESGLVSYEPYAGVTLTHAGRQLATRVLRRHRLVELFLVRIVGLNWSDVHEEAEVLEHVVSDRVLERIDQMLGRPSVDPHGDPIPTARGEVPEQPNVTTLRECPLSRSLRVVRVTDQRTDFLRLLERHGVMPGRPLRVNARDELADTVDLTPDSGEDLRLGMRAASMILVEVS